MNSVNQGTTGEDGGPLLSAILVTARSFASLRRSLGHLRRQTIMDRIEILIVAPAADSLADMPEGALDGFWGSRIVPVGPIENGDKQAAAAIRLARAPFIGFVEDHAWVDPVWAETLVRALADGWTAVGTRIENGNPRTGLSWGSYLIAYGTWFGPQPSRPVAQVARHNIGVQRAALLALDPGLEDTLGRDGNLIGELAARGGRYYASTGSVVEHVNGSRLGSTFRLRFNAGRLSAWKRWKRQRWSIAKRMLYVASCAAFPALRYARIRADLSSRDVWRLVPRHGRRGLAIALVFDAMGQLAGFLTGIGSDTIDYLARFEMDRAVHLVKPDLQELDPGQVQ